MWLECPASKNTGKFCYPRLGPVKIEVQQGQKKWFWEEGKPGMWEEGVKLRSICWQGGGWESEGLAGVVSLKWELIWMRASTNPCLPCWVERSWTSPHLSLGNYTHVYTCAQLPRSASAGPIAGRRPSTASIPSKPRAYAEEGHSKCWARVYHISSATQLLTLLVAVFNTIE